MSFYESAEDIFSEIEQEIFEEQHNVKVDELQFPIVVIDQAAVTDGYVFQADQMYDLREKALEYFKRK